MDRRQVLKTAAIAGAALAVSSCGQTKGPRARERLTLWAGTVRTKTFDERLEAARAGGFTSMSIFPADVRKFEAEGLSAGEMRRKAEGEGVPITVLDPLTRWLPNAALPAGLDAGTREFHAYDENAYFRAAEALGVRHVNMFEPWNDRFPLEVLAENFARVCDRARDLGMDAQIEFMPFSGIKDLRTTWEVVRTADRPNGRITFDYWHFMRGRPELDLIATIPGDRIGLVQVTDAHRELQAATLIDDCMHHRLLPGTGAFPVAEITRALRRVGGDRDIGLEIFSDEYDTLPPLEAGARGGESLRGLLASTTA